MTSQKFKNPMVMILGHRGSPLRAPENSLLSFQKAIEEGAHGIECDVRLTREGQVLIFHDETMLRLTGRRGLFRNHSAAQLQKLHLSHPSKKFRNILIPSLQEVLKTLGKRDFFYIELKPDASSVSRGRYLAQRTMDEVEKLNLIHRTLLVSFDYALIRWLKKKNPQFFTGLNFSKLDELKVPRKDTFKYLNYLCPEVSLVDSRLVKEARTHSLDIMTWVVNDRRTLKRMICLGVKGIVTDDPKKMILR